MGWMRSAVLTLIACVSEAGCCEHRKGTTILAMLRRQTLSELVTVIAVSWSLLLLPSLLLPSLNCVLLRLKSLLLVKENTYTLSALIKAPHTKSKMIGKSVV